MREPLRLLVLNCEYPPLGGGAATATMHLLANLRRQGVEWDLVTAAPGGTPRVEKRGRCAIHFVPVGKKSLHYWTNRELLRYAAAAMRRSRPLVRRRRFHLCHAFFTLPSGAVAWLLRKRLPYIVSLRGSDVPGFSGRYGLFHAVTPALTRRVWRAAGAVTANSDDLRALALESDPGLSIDVIGNGVDTRTFTPGEFRPGGRRVLTVARLVPRKDVPTVLRAVALLRGEVGGVTLTIVGDGPEAHRIEGLSRRLGAADAVEMRRSVPRGEMPEVYRQADAFVLTSRREGMSNTILEALACGLPVVASRQAMAGIEFDGVRLVEPGDAAAVAGALEDFFRDDRARRAAGEAARAAADRYDWDGVAADYLRIYRRVAAREGSGR